MDNLKTAKTYERYSLKFKNQQSKLLSDLFDKVTEDATDQGNHGSNCDSTPATQDCRNRRLQNTERVEAVVLGAEKGGVERMECTPSVSHSAGNANSSPCPLFQSPCEVESHPKKSIHRPGVGGPRKRGKKGMCLYGKFQKVARRSSVVPRSSTPVVASPDYPSIETFRDLKKQSLDRSDVQKEADSSCRKWLESLSESEKTMASSSTGKQQTEQPSLLSKSVNPAGVRQHSFIKIRTPLPVASAKRAPTVVCYQPEEVETSSDDGDEEEKEEVSSYTTVYTWTTASGTNTATSTAGTGMSSKGRGGGGGRQHGGGEPEEMTCGGRSPTLVLKTCPQVPLQSTAIHPHLLDHTHLQHTPHVSPIKAPSDEDVHRTPSAPTHYVSPRGPRKSQSFLSMRGRGMPPKCSTMLFASPMADAGDAPLDVSSIRAALSEAVDLNEDGKKKEETLFDKEGQAKGVGDRVLTSTPCGDRSRKFKWNLSSVELPEEDDDLLMMNSSRDTVNSEEIVARTVSDASLQDADYAADDREEPAAVEGEGRAVQGGEASSSSSAGRSRGESGVVLTSGAEDSTDSVTHPPTPLQPAVLPVVTSPVVDSSVGHLLHRPRPRPDRKKEDRNKEECPTLQNDNAPGQHMHISGRGDGFGYKNSGRKGFLQRLQEVTPTAGKILSREEAHSRGSSRSHDEEIPQPQDYGGNSNNRIYGENCDDESPPFIFQQREEVGEGREGGCVPPCPVSTVGMRGREGPPPLQQLKAGLLMCIEPADSGFLDMVTSTPPDIIGVVSRKMKGGKFPSPP